MVIVAKQKRKQTAFGLRLRALREAAGLSQSQLGERADPPLSYQTIARYERGAVEPTWPTVLAIADALGVSTDEFKGDSSDEPPAGGATGTRPRGK